MKNIIDMKTGKPVLGINAELISGTPYDWYSSNIKFELATFIYTKVNHLDNSEIMEKLNINEEQLKNLKNVRVSKLTFKELIKALFNLGYVLDIFVEKK